MTEKHYTIHGNIEHFTIADIAQENPEFRKVLWTGQHSQVVIMTVPVGGEIGDEVHPNTDQILTLLSGRGEADLSGETHRIDAGDQCAVPAGTPHTNRNTGAEPLVRATLDSPPTHAVGGTYATKEQADTAKATGQDEPPQS